MLILASQSASRTAMLAAAGVPFTAEPAHADEATSATPADRAGPSHPQPPPRACPCDDPFHAPSRPVPVRHKPMDSRCRCAAVGTADGLTRRQC